MAGRKATRRRKNKERMSRKRRKVRGKGKKMVGRQEVVRRGGGRSRERKRNGDGR